MQYVITAYDGKDALDRRLAVRPRHLENMSRLKGRVYCAGGILDENGKPKGSVLVVDFATRELLEEYLATEPYIVEQVWEDVRAEPMNLVILDGEKIGK